MPKILGHILCQRCIKSCSLAMHSASSIWWLCRLIRTGHLCKAKWQDAIVAKWDKVAGCHCGYPFLKFNFTECGSTAEQLRASLLSAALVGVSLWPGSSESTSKHLPKILKYRTSSTISDLIREMYLPGTSFTSVPTPYSSFALHYTSTLTLKH